MYHPPEAVMELPPHNLDPKKSVQLDNELLMTTYGLTLGEPPGTMSDASEALGGPGWPWNEPWHGAIPSDQYGLK